MPPGERVGGAWYEVDADDGKLRDKIRGSEQALKSAGATGEKAFGSPIQRAMQGVRDKLAGISKDSGGLANSVLAGVGLGAGVATFQSLGSVVENVTGFLGDSVAKAKEEQVGIDRLTASLKANVVGFDGNTDAIEKVIAARERLAFSDGEQRDSLARLVAITKDSTKALDIQRTAMDLARLKGISLGSASELLGKVYAGNVTMLKRYGIEVRDGATATEALAAVQKQAAGQAEAFANNSAGASQSLSIVLEDLQEQVGQFLLPAITKLTLFARDQLVPALQQVFEIAGNVAHVAGPILSPIVDHLGVAIQSLALLLVAKFTYGAAQAAKQLLGMGAAASAAAVGVEAQNAALSGASGSAGDAADSLDAAAGASDALNTASNLATASGGRLTKVQQAEAAAAGAATVATEAQAAATTEAAVANDALAASGKGFALSIKGIGLASLVAVPLIDSLQKAGDGLILQWQHGAQFGKDFARVIQTTGDNTVLQQVVFSTLEGIAKQQGRTIQSVTADYLRFVDAGDSVTDALGHTKDAASILSDELEQNRSNLLNAQRGTKELTAAYADLADDLKGPLDQALNDTGASLSKAGDLWAAQLRTGEMVYASSAEELTARLPKAQQQALEDAKAIAKKTPYEIAKSFDEGKDAVYQAALALADQQHAAQDDALELTQKKNELASDDLRKQLKSKDKGTKAAAQEHVNQLKDEIFALQAKIDPKAALASETLAKWLASSDPQTRRKAEALAQSLRDALDSQLPAVQALSDELGLSLPDALEKYRADAKVKADAQAAAALAALQEHHTQFTATGVAAGGAYGSGIGATRPNAVREAHRLFGGAVEGADGDLSSVGYHVGLTYGAGLSAATSVVDDKARQLRAGVTRILQFAGSPAYTHSRRIGREVAISWADGQLDALTDVRRRVATWVDAAASLMARSVAPSLAAAVPAVAASAPPSSVATQAVTTIAGSSAPLPSQMAAQPSITTFEFHLHTDGPVPVKTDEQLANLFDRLLFSTKRVVPEASPRG